MALKIMEIITKVIYKNFLNKDIIFYLINLTIKNIFKHFQMYIIIILLYYEIILYMNRKQKEFKLNENY
jgi:hypothetical protein